MKFGTIGLGNIGNARTRRFRAAGHDVMVANARGSASLADLAREASARPASVEDTARRNEAIVVAVSLKQVGNLPSWLFADASADLIVIDTSNFHPQQRDGLIAEGEAGLTESAWVEQPIRHPVVKTFNMIVAPLLLASGKAAGTPGRIAPAVAGNKPSAKATVMQLLDGIGFDAVDAGSIGDSWRQQPGTPVSCKDLDADDVRRALGEARHERTPQWRTTPNSPGTYAVPA